MSAWVDYRKLRESLDFAIVLDHYRVQYKRKGTQVQAYCPLPKHEGHQNSPAFSVSLEKRIFQCFGCGAKGNVLDFVSLMQNLNPRDSSEFRRAAIFAQATFVSTNDVRSTPATKAPTKQPLQSQQPAIRVHHQKSVLVNQPLDFELKESRHAAAIPSETWLYRSYNRTFRSWLLQQRHFCGPNRHPASRYGESANWLRRPVDL